MKHIRIRIIFIVSAIIATVLPAFAQEWTADILGDGFEMRHCLQDDSLRSTIIRKLPGEKKTARAVLYVHGFNDYFFQSGMADRFVDHGYAFYAVDLRRYGRSLMPGQKPFSIRNVNEYFPDIDSALVQIARDGFGEVALMGHSTGGLITSCFLARNQRPQIKALVLNSPFLDWNLGWQECLVPLISLWGKYFPDARIPQGMSHAYAESLLASGHGEWNYRTDWKFIQSPDVDAGWVRAITLAQKSLRDGKADIRVPILLMYSDHSVYGTEWTPEFNRGDAVLDVKDIRRYGLGLGPYVTPVRIVGGLHDLVLSAGDVREPLFRYIFRWLDTRVVW